MLWWCEQDHGCVGPALWIESFCSLKTTRTRRLKKPKWEIYEVQPILQVSVDCEMSDGDAKSAPAAWNIPSKQQTTQTNICVNMWDVSQCGLTWMMHGLSSPWFTACHEANRSIWDLFFIWTYPWSLWDHLRPSVSCHVQPDHVQPDQWQPLCMQTHWCNTAIQQSAWLDRRVAAYRCIAVSVLQYALLHIYVMGESVICAKNVVF